MRLLIDALTGRKTYKYIDISQLLISHIFQNHSYVERRLQIGISSETVLCCNIHYNSTSTTISYENSHHLLYGMVHT